jgi:hypothetical protein
VTSKVIESCVKSAQGVLHCREILKGLLNVPTGEVKQEDSLRRREEGPCDWAVLLQLVAKLYSQISSFDFEAVGERDLFVSHCMWDVTDIFTSSKENFAIVQEVGLGLRDVVVIGGQVRLEYIAIRGVRIQTSSKECHGIFQLYRKVSIDNLVLWVRSAYLFWSFFWASKRSAWGP